MTAAPQVQPDPFHDSSVNPALTPKRRKRPKRYKENPEFMKVVRAMIRQCVVRVGGQGDLEGLADLDQVVKEAEKARADSVALLREQGFPWSEVGRVLGVSRQAAQQKYGKGSLE